MKFSKYKYIVSALILLSISGCSQEEFADGGSSSIDGVKISLNIEGASNPLKSNSETSVDYESTISNLYLLFYEKGTAIRDVVKCYIPQTSLNHHGQWTGTLVLPAIVSGQEYDVYAFANIPQATASKLSATINRGALKGLTEELSARQDSLGRSISFSATTTYTGGQEESLDIMVKRTVAKLQVGIDMSGLVGQWQLESVKVLSEMQKTSYIGANPTTPRIESYNAFKVEGKDSVYYYLYENAKSTIEDNQVKLQINVANKTSHDTRSYTAIVNKKGASEIIRNKIYKSKILLVEGSDPVELSLDTLTWDRENIDVDIPSVYLDLPSNAVELTSIGSGQLYFKSNADSVKVTWKDNNGLLINSSGSLKEILKPSGGLENYKIDFSMPFAVQVATKDTITLSVGNLVKTVAVIKPVPNYFLKISMLPMDNYPNEIKKYKFDTDKDVEIKTHVVSDHSVELWYRIKCTKRLNDDGSQTPHVYMVYSGFLPTNEDHKLNLMEAVTGTITKGLFEYEVAILYGDNVGAVIAKQTKFYIEKLN